MNVLWYLLRQEKSHTRGGKLITVTEQSNDGLLTAEQDNQIFESTTIMFIYCVFTYVLQCKVTRPVMCRGDESIPDA